MIFRIVIAGLIGGGIGFLIGYFGRCASGVCPLTSNPIISTIVGVILGIILGVSR